MCLTYKQNMDFQFMTNFVEHRTKVITKVTTGRTKDIKP